MTRIHPASINNPNFGKINYRKFSDAALSDLREQCEKNAEMPEANRERALLSIQQIDAEIQRRGDKWMRTPEPAKHMRAVTDAIVARREFGFIQDDGTQLSADEVAEVMAEAREDIPLPQ